MHRQRGGLQGGDEFIHGWRHQIEERRGIEADPEDEDQDRDDGCNLSPVQVTQGVTMLLDLVHDLALRTEEHFLEHVQNINGGHDDANGGNTRKPRRTDGGGAERAKQDGELAHEAVQAGQSHRGERHDEHDRTVDGRDLP